MYCIVIKKASLMVISMFIYHGIHAPRQAHLHMSLECSFIPLTSPIQLRTVLPGVILLNKKCSFEYLSIRTGCELSSITIRIALLKTEAPICFQATIPTILMHCENHHSKLCRLKATTECLHAH